MMAEVAGIWRDVAAACVIVGRCEARVRRDDFGGGGAILTKIAPYLVRW